MTITFHSYGRGGTETTLELDERQSSIIEKLNEPTRLALTLTSETAPMITLGAHITYQGVTYYVTSEPTVRKEHSKLFVVEAELETSIGLARHVILSNPVDKRASFDYTATATEHLQLAIDSLNGKFATDRITWSRGAVHCKDTTKHLKYDGITVWEALQQIREAYETDIFIDGSTISLGRMGDKSNALPLAYGKGKGLLSGLERLKHNDDTTPMCLYVTGTKRNMTTGRLTLERSQLLKVTDTGTIQRNPTDLDGQIYTTDSTGQCIADYSADNVFDALYTETVYTNEEIYPSHVSTIRSVTKVKDHYEVNSDLDYSKLRIDGEQMQVVFQTGNLAGRDFDANYYPSTGRIAIVPKEEDDTTLPNDTLCPKVGDQYIVTGIKLPDEYIKEAQRKLTDEALRHLVKLQRQRYSYKAEIDPVYLHNNHDKIAPQLTVGRYVHLTDPHIAVGDPYIRIVGKRTYLDRPYQPEIELSNEVEPPSLLTSILDQIDNSSLLERLRNDMKGVEHLSVSIHNLTSDATNIKQRLEGAEQSIAGKLDRSVFDKFNAEDFKVATERLTTAETEISKKLDSGVFDKWKAGDYSQRQSALDEAIKSKQPAGNYALSSELESHKRATDKSFEALANHPLAVDKDGYWRIWSVKDNQYVTTQYPSRGQAGADGKNAGRYLGKAKRIHPDFNGNYILETESSWRTAEEGDYVYLVGDLSNRGGDKDTYYIVRERKSSTVWEEYNIKGRSPEVYLGRDHYLYVDGVKQQYLKGEDGRDGEPGHSPSPKEVLGSSDFSALLVQEVDRSVKPKLISYQESIDSHNQRIEAVEETYKVIITTRGEIRNAKVYDGVIIDDTPAIQHTAHIYSLLGSDRSTTLGHKLTWTINKGRTAETDKPRERTVTGLVCNVYDSDLVDNGITPRYYDIELERREPDTTTLEYKAHVTSQDSAGSKNLVQDGLSPVSLVDGCFQYRLYTTDYDREGTFTFSFNVSRVKRPPKGGQFLIKFFPGSRYERLEYIPFENGKRRYSVTTIIAGHATVLTTAPDKPIDLIEVYPNSKEEYYKAPNSGDLVLDYVKLERGAVATEWTPAPEDILRDISNANEEIRERARAAHLDNAFKYIQNIVREIDSSRSYTISESGYISSSVHKRCRYVSKEEAPSSIDCSIPNTQPQIRLTLRSDYDTLKAQVQTLAIKVAQLEARNVIKPDLSRGGQSTIYPKYDEWILTSDSREQSISFAGLNAEIGRSIYVQTRHKAYLSANRHSFYGLPGNSNSIKVDQTLAANTTYRFVRASLDSWLVTASSSPYPWT